jgi:hypothetical protein
VSENVDDMQTMLNVFSEYYNTWKLQVNIAKTKVVIFSKSKVTQNARFIEKRKGKCFSICLTPTLLAN